MPLSRHIALALVAIGFVPFAHAADRRQSYADLAAASDRVLLGTIGSRASHWGDDAHIYTDLLVYPDLALKGTDDGAVVVRLLGGTVGDTTMTVSDGPELPDGERVLVFLKREKDHFVVVGRAAGAVSVRSADITAALDSVAPHLDRARGGTVGAATAHAATQNGCYSTDGAKWTVSSATYQIGPTVPAGWTGAIDAATATWNAVGVGFRLVNDSASVNELSYKDLVAAYGSSYSNTFAVTTTWSSTSTGRISKASIEINNKWPWSTGGEANMADVQNILTHEFGHWMRLLDIYSPSTCGDVTMWGSAAFGETKKRTLDQADIDGFQSLYSGTTPAAAPGAPVLTAPANGASGVATTAALTWAAAANATSYDVYFGASSFPAFAATVGGTSYQPGALTAGATYYWRVVAKNAAGSAGSATYSFTVAAGAPPPTTSTLTLLSPADGATDVATRPVMQWTSVTGATTYDLYVGTGTNPGRIGSVNGTTVTVNGLRSGTLYRWKVVARTPNGPVSSAVASFRTN